MAKRGAGCSVEGKKYELLIYDIAKRCVSKITGKTFNSQSPEELGGSSAENDIVCNWTGERDIPIEIKKKTPDWMQCSLKYNETTGLWSGGVRNKIPEASKIIFQELLKDRLLFNGKVPPFLTGNITHEKWVKIKSETDDFNDVYFDCPPNTIARLYGEKGCKYIQIHGKGLYHLGQDVCEFGVPLFSCEQQMRVRTKIHERNNKKGFCSLSVTIACQPKQIKDLESSPYSLDCVDRLPENLDHLSETTLG
jgi:hypothetical protein